MEQKVSSPFLPSYTKSYSQTRFDVTTSEYTWKIDQFGRLSAIVDTLNSPPFGENNQYKIQMDISRKDLLCAIRISIRTNTAFSGSCTTTIMHPPEKARSEATFRYTVENISEMKNWQLSPAFYVRNLPWKITVRPPRSSQTQENQRSLGFYLQCDGESESTSWSCYAVAELRLLSCKEGQKPFIRKTKHLFNIEKDSWGFPNFMTWEDVLDPDRGFIKDDSITLEARVEADAVLSSRSISCLISDMTLLIDVSDRSYISTEAFIIHCKIENFQKLINNTIHMNLQLSAPVFKEVKSLEDSTFEFASKDDKSIKFIVGEEEYVISKKTLCDTNSSYFKYICLTHKEKEKDMTNELVTDDEVESFQQVLLYIITDSIDQGDYKMLRKLLTASDKYDVQTLKLTCQHYLLRSLTIENAVELVQLAFSSNAKFLETHSATFIKFHIKEIRDTKAFQSVSQEDLSKIMEFIEKSKFEVSTDQFSLSPPNT
ncbi:speckle-type POZ protein-like [Temnothorax longispinosus]|uniref:speckle-type POZ protein-like n=1 Tax=Temnothorax longispinosus TaxID=300112 RepID=UPI003A9964F5